jgi:hypothetical protein
MQLHRLTRENAVADERPSPGSVKYCAYNLTRECFLCAGIEAGDFQPASLDARLRSLSPGENIALWMVPARAVSATSVRSPIDLLYLDRNSVILDAVESFPLASPSSAGAQAASILVLPANTIASARTQAGDRLLLCAPAEMKRQLQQALSPAAKAEEARPKGQASTVKAAAGRVLEWVREAQPAPVSDAPLAEVQPITPAVPEQPQPAFIPVQPAPEEKQKKSLRGWLQNVLSTGPKEPRRAARQTVHGLSAFFFTGTGTSAHSIRDISSTGMYVFTEERWYPGTIIRMTLTHRDSSGAEQSITVHAFSVRWGSDGVGLEFVFPDVKNPRIGATISMDGLMGGVTRAHLDRFLAYAASAVR